MKSVCLSLLLLTGTSIGESAETYRKDINPATQYYQAFILAPDLPQADRDYLFNNEWRGRKLPPRFGELVGRYDNQFKLVRRAAQATVPCDWGIDMSPGPMTLLPQLARNKAIAQTARLRAMWALQQGRPADARDDLLAAFALARNCSRDGTLIAALVQIAMESILCSAVAENFYQLSPEILQDLVDGFAAAPARGTIAACISTERVFFPDWMLARIQELQQATPGNDTKVMAGIRELWTSVQGSEEGQTNQPASNRWEEVMKASGGTSEGVVKLLRALEPLYQQLSVIMALPLSEYEAQIKPFYAEVFQSKNPFVTEMFPALENCRAKEFAALVQLAMVRAAAEYKSHGEAGWQSVADPCGQGPFAFERFVFEGVDRGFQLKSTYAGRRFQEGLIFVEKDGPPFQVMGKNAGLALPKSAITK
jgi:hypothetical protein